MNISIVYFVNINLPYIDFIKYRNFPVERIESIPLIVGLMAPINPTECLRHISLTPTHF